MAEADVVPAVDPHHQRCGGAIGGQPVGGAHAAGDGQPGPPTTSAPSRRTEVASASMTMAFAIVALSAVNLGVVVRREREVPWSQPLFPYFGWILLGWGLTWAAVEMGMFQRILDTQPLTGDQWFVVVAASLLMPAAAAVQRLAQVRRAAVSAAVPALRGP